MDENFKTLIHALIGGFYLVSASVIFAGFIICVTLSGNDEINGGGAFFGIIAVLNMAMLYLLGIGGLYKAAKKINS